MSLSQLWVVGGSGAGTQTLEAGYQTSNRFSDNLPHLFIYSTSDGYATGCYDLDCPPATRFVKTSNVLNFGSVLTNTSTTAGTQIEGCLAFYRDPVNGNWILFYVDPAGNHTQSGYYPKANFGTGQLSRNATFLEFGGEIAYLGARTSHTATDMGSGQFAKTGFRNAAYRRNLKYIDLNGVIQNVSFSTSAIANAGCYSLSSVTTPGNATWGTYLYFGGSGYSITL
ncbi:MAG: neprosin family prolyl endopeptidase [Methylococcaceae bacterium]|nr:neprosin family prolyl endopeptidase [Methylococcaceae bacterium]